MPLSLIRRYSVYLAFCDGWAQVPDGWAQIIDDWAQARSGPPLATPLNLFQQQATQAQYTVPYNQSTTTVAVPLNLQGVEYYE